MFEVRSLLLTLSIFPSVSFPSVCFVKLEQVYLNWGKVLKLAFYANLTDQNIMGKLIVFHRVRDRRKILLLISSKFKNQSIFIPPGIIIKPQVLPGLPGEYKLIDLLQTHSLLKAKLFIIKSLFNAKILKYLTMNISCYNSTNAAPLPDIGTCISTGSKNDI